MNSRIGPGCKLSKISNLLNNLGNSVAHILLGTELIYARHILTGYIYRILTHHVRGSVTVWLTSCLAGLDSTEQVNMLIISTKQYYNNYAAELKRVKQ